MVENMKGEILSEFAKHANHAQELDQLTQCVLGQIRGALIEEHVQTGFSRATAENLIDLAWVARGWPVLCEEQQQNIERWSLN